MGIPILNENTSDIVNGKTIYKVLFTCNFSRVQLLHKVCGLFNSNNKNLPFNDQDNSHWNLLTIASCLKQNVYFVF